MASKTSKPDGASLTDGDNVQIDFCDGTMMTVRVTDIWDDSITTHVIEDTYGYQLREHLTYDDGIWAVDGRCDVLSVTVVFNEGDDTDAENIWVAADDAGILMTDGGHDVHYDETELAVGDIVDIHLVTGDTVTAHVWDTYRYSGREVYSLEDGDGEWLPDTLIREDCEWTYSFHADVEYIHVQGNDESNEVSSMSDVVDLNQMYWEELTSSRFVMQGSLCSEYDIPSENVWPALFAAYERLTGEPANDVEARPVAIGGDLKGDF